MSNKTISINPSLFSIGGRTKTKKNKDDKSKPKMLPLISPNVLKNKLLKRIKEHKQKETNQLKDKKINIEIEPNQESKNEINNFNDEFTNSINYLQTLSKQNKINMEKNNIDKLKQKRKEEIERKTLKHYNELNMNPIVNIDLPEELNQPIIQEPFKINSPQKINDVPYGILKGGTKPMYREWAKTQRNNIVTNPNASLIIQGEINTAKNARENRLNLLKQKIQNKNEESKIDPFITENLIRTPVVNVVPVVNVEPITNVVPVTNVEPINGKIIATKHITKKTIKRKYTLGRSKFKKTISVLIKDRVTRKKILNAQKDLKRKNINDIKVYLRDHNFIKSGSNAPNDVLRKIYESSMLSGEITNINSENLLHNFSKENNEL